ncbi:uncharacterized protein METZ01_LOCUS150771, partial [marine metagenome]
MTPLVDLAEMSRVNAAGSTGASQAP